MNKTQAILKGTFILTLTGFATRVIGFFYRMFLSRAFGEESVGLYQLIFPIYALCFSLTSAGFQIAISRCVARKTSSGQEKEARRIVLAGLSFSLLFSIIIMILLQQYSYDIALHIIKDIRCQSLLILISYSLPFASIHSCICGYYLGLTHTKIPALSQFVEQVIRVLSVYICWILSNRGASIQIAAAGIVFGEIASSLFCLYHFSGKQKPPSFYKLIRHGKTYFAELFSLTIPLTANRVLLNLLQSVEAICIPLRLQYYGHSTSDALKIYGVLTGMALPCILFPSAITNSVSTLMLPTIADLQASKNKSQLLKLITKVSSYCFFLGFLCCIGFLLTGNWMGSHLFHSDFAGDFILILAWICPFLYTNSTFISMINGLGKVNTSFFINLFGLLMRVYAVLFLIPHFGIKGYLWGLLASQLSIAILSIFFLYRIMKKESLL